MRRHVLLNACVEDLHFVAAENNDRTASLEVIEGATSLLDCEKYLNTQLDCDNGEMIKVIISNLYMVNNVASFELVTIMIHGFCDRMSVRDLHPQFITWLATVGSNVNNPDCLFVLSKKPLKTAIPLPTIHHAQTILSECLVPAAGPLPLPEHVPIYIRTGDTLVED